MPWHQDVGQSITLARGSTPGTVTVTIGGVTQTGYTLGGPVLDIEVDALRGAALTIDRSISGSLSGGTVGRPEE